MVERDDGRRLLLLNEGVAVHSVWRPDTVLTGGVWDTFLALPPLLDRPLRKRGDPRQRRRHDRARARPVYYPDAQVDGVELDPAVAAPGGSYFGMEDNPSLTVHDADARPFLRRTDERYDLIVVDAYHQPYVPFYLATREFFRLARERLRPGGIVALNVASVPGDDSLLDGIAGTLAARVAAVAVWPALRFNKIVLAFDGPDAYVRDPRWRTWRRRAAAAACAARPQMRPVTTKAERPWTDDRAPVEWVTDRMIVEYAAAGGELDEDFLPTRRRREAAARRRAADPRRAPGRGGARAREHAALVRGGARAGVDAIEFDVLDAGRGRSCSATPLAELGRSRATLDERARLPRRRDVALHVDLKLTTRLDELAAALDRHGVADRAVVSSFHLPSLQRDRGTRAAASDRLHLSRGPVRRLEAARAEARDPARHARASARGRDADPRDDRAGGCAAR